MKTRRTIYMVIGIILVVLNLLIDLASLGEKDFQPGDDSFSIAYIIGFNFLLIIGLVLLRSAYKLHKKIKQQKEIESINSIGDSGC